MAGQAGSDSANFRPKEVGAVTPKGTQQTGDEDPHPQESKTTETGEQEPNFVAFVGIDWGDQEHAWSMEIPGCRKRLTGKLKHPPEAIAAGAVELAVRFEGRPVAVALEQARGALLYALSAYGHLVLYPVHPTTSSRYREAIFPSGSKNDPKDADATLDLLVRHRDRLRRYQPDTPQTRKLRVLVQKRRQLVDERTAQTNRITDLLKLYFPQVLDWFDEIGAPLVEAFLERWPTLEQVQKEDAEELRKFFHQHQCRSPQRIQERWDAIREARPLIRDIAVIDPSALVVAALLPVVAALRKGVAALDHAIEGAAAAHVDLAIFASFPGAGPVMAPRLVAAFGSLRGHFASANEIQSFQRHCTGGLTQRRDPALDSFPLGLCQVFAADLPRVRSPLHSAVCLGPRVLPTAEGQGQRASCRGPGAGLQMDPHPVSLLAEPHSLSGRHLSAHGGAAMCGCRSAEGLRASTQLRHRRSGHKLPPIHAWGPWLVEARLISSGKKSAVSGKYLLFRLDRLPQRPGLATPQFAFKRRSSERFPRNAVVIGPVSRSGGVPGST